jgi:hypothetical protein
MDISCDWPEASISKAYQQGSGKGARRRVVIWDYGISLELVRNLGEAGIEVVATIQGDVEGVPSYSVGDLHQGVWLHNDVPNLPRLDPDPEFLQRYIRCVSRIGLVPGTGAIEFHDGGALDASEVHHLAAIHLEQAARLLHLHRVAEVWFFTIPHLGVDIALDYAARCLGLRVIALRQLPVPLKFQYSVWRGFEYIPVTGLRFKTWASGAQNLNLFYMQPRQWEPVVPGFLRRAWDFSRLLSRGRFAELLGRGWRASRDRGWWNAAALLQLLDRRTLRQAGFAISRRRESTQARALRRMARPEDFELPFVYFAMHYEPEANIDVYGGKWTSQVDAIERLSDALPPNWKVILKENPKQTHVRRPALFYRRIAQLKSVVWAGDTADTAQLLGKSALAATHCGTIGWESLAVGRAFVYFGDPWFAGLPGAIKWSDGLDLAEVATLRVSRDELDAAANELLSTAADGLIYARHSVLLPDGMDRATIAAITSRSLVAISTAVDQTHGQER